MSSPLSSPDWTEVWMSKSPLTAGEVGLSVVLVFLTIILELLSSVVHYKRDHYSRLDTRVVRSYPEQIESTRNYGYNFRSHFTTLQLVSAQVSKTVSSHNNSISGLLFLGSASCSLS